MKSIFISIFIFIVSLAGATDKTGSTYLVDTIRHFEHSRSQVSPEEQIIFVGHFVPDGQYDSLVNTGNFQADVTLVYKNTILAFDYYIQNDKFEKNIFTGWYEDEHKKLCEVQGVKNAPYVPYEIDLFYLNKPPYQGDRNFANLKIIDLNSGQTFEYDTWNEDVRSQTFVISTYMKMEEDKSIAKFRLYPEVLRTELRYFLSKFPFPFAFSEGDKMNLPIAADDNYNIVQRKLLVNQFTKEDIHNWSITATVQGEGQVTFAPVTSGGNNIIYGRFGDYTFALHPNSEEESTDDNGIKWCSITNFTMNIEKNGYVVVQAQSKAGTLRTNFSDYGPKEVTFLAENMELNWVKVPGVDKSEAQAIINEFIK